MAGLAPHDPGDYVGRHRRKNRLSVGTVYWSRIVGRFRRVGGMGGWELM